MTSKLVTDDMKHHTRLIVRPPSSLVIEEEEQKSLDSVINNLPLTIVPNMKKKDSNGLIFGDTKR
jgi:hypothetical protein